MAYQQGSAGSQEQSAAGASAQPRPLQMGAKGAYIVRLLMVGDSSCGKTSLVLRFDQNVFSTKFVTTIGVDYRDKMVKVSLFLLQSPVFCSANLYRLYVLATRNVSLTLCLDASLC
jgi:hypothetical protein